MEMICENAGKCAYTKCHNQKEHIKDPSCILPCNNPKGIIGSKCIPYVPASAPFDGAVDLLAREQERKIKHVEAIVGKPLTDHVKFCRLSEQPGSLCVHAGNGGIALKTYCNELHASFIDRHERCAIPSKQQPVELPKPDPLEELMEETIAIITTRSCGRIGNVTARDLLNKFIAKVGALNG